MPFLSPPQAEVEYARLPQRDLFALLEKQNPKQSLSMAHLLRNEFQRDRLQRKAFLAEPSAQWAPAFLDRPWLGETNFFRAVEIARSLDAPAAKKLLAAVALRNPGLAIREVDAYWGLPAGKATFELAALFAPEEAVVLIGGSSVTAKLVTQAVNECPRPEMLRLTQIAADKSLDAPAKARAAVLARFGRPPADGLDYFSTLVSLREKASGADVLFLDRALENYAQILFRFFGERKEASKLGQLSAGELCLLLSYGRSEADDNLFNPIFDRLVLSRASSSLELPDFHLRKFLAIAAIHRRLDTFLARDTSAVARAFANIETLEDAVAAAEIIEGASAAGVLAAMKTAIDAHPENPLYGLLAARLGARLEGKWDLAERFKPYFRAPRALLTAPLFGSKNICIERYFFYDDDDGEESYEAFKHIYERDPAWRFEEKGGYVTVTAKGAGGRRIEIYANVPSAAGRQDEISRLLAARGVEPAVVVHRGHSFHLDKSLRYLTASAKLVFLGSCRGMDRVETVIGTAGGAQMIATRAVGTSSINDPLLKAINDQLLRGTAELDWSAFWAAQEAKLGRNAQFEDYVPPHKNATAIFLSAYFNYAETN
jgi:hypothetical protein